MSLINQNTVESSFKDIPINPTPIKLTAYGGADISVLGKLSLYRFSRTVLAPAAARSANQEAPHPAGCRPSFCRVSTILQQTWTDCMLLAVKEVGDYGRSRPRICTSLHCGVGLSSPG